MQCSMCLATRRGELSLRRGPRSHADATPAVSIDLRSAWHAARRATLTQEVASPAVVQRRFRRHVRAVAKYRHRFGSCGPRDRLGTWEPGWRGRLRAVDLVGGLVTEVSRLSALHDRVLVGIDGPDSAGKTTLADELSEALDVPTVRVSVDGFVRPREQRYGRGDRSPDGYYVDSFDYLALFELCLPPFLGGSARVSTASYDHSAGAEVTTSAAAVPTKAVLVVDGVFLLRPELRDVWTLSV